MFLWAAKSGSSKWVNAKGLMNSWWQGMLISSWNKYLDSSIPVSLEPKFGDSFFTLKQDPEGNILEDLSKNFASCFRAFCRDLKPPISPNVNLMGLVERRSWWNPGHSWIFSRRNRTLHGLQSLQQTRCLSAQPSPSKGKGGYIEIKTDFVLSNPMSMFIAKRALETKRNSVSS